MFSTQQNQYIRNSIEFNNYIRMCACVYIFLNETGNRTPRLNIYTIPQISYIYISKKKKKNPPF